MINSKLKALYYILDALMRNNQCFLILLLEEHKTISRRKRAFNIALTNSQSCRGSIDSDSSVVPTTICELVTYQGSSMHMSSLSTKYLHLPYRF